MASLASVRAISPARAEGARHMIPPTITPDVVADSIRAWIRDEYRITFDTRDICYASDACVQTYAPRYRVGTDITITIVDRDGGIRIRAGIVRQTLELSASDLSQVRRWLTKVIRLSQQTNRQQVCAPNAHTVAEFARRLAQRGWAPRPAWWDLISDYDRVIVDNIIPLHRVIWDSGWALHLADRDYRDDVKAAIEASEHGIYIHVLNARMDHPPAEITRLRYLHAEICVSDLGDQLYQVDRYGDNMLLAVLLRGTPRCMYAEDVWSEIDPIGRRRSQHCGDGRRHEGWLVPSDSTIVGVICTEEIWAAELEAAGYHVYRSQEGWSA